MRKNKRVSSEKSEYPECPSCGQAMVFTMAFPYQEYACLPCNETDEFFPKNERVLRSIKYMDAKKKKWSDELHRISCIEIVNYGKCTYKEKNGKCSICDNKHFQFKYWKSKVRI